MGAMAISTLAGTVLADRAADFHLLAERLPFLNGLTPIILGNGDLVDTAARNTGGMATRIAKGANQL